MENPRDWLNNHWYPRPGWTESARYLTWHLVPDDSAELRAVAEEYQRVLFGLPGLDIVPRRWLHLTVQGVGFVDRVTPAERAAVVLAGRRNLAESAAIDLTFGPADAADEGVLLAGSPAGPVAALRACLRAAIADALGAERVPGDDDEQIWPHVSLAYANAAVPAEPINAALRELGLGVTAARFRSVSLLELRREEHLYCWDRVADVPLVARTITGSGADPRGG
jgi:hypothetical protein